jgi:menaquinone-dependent protoporphyrinogen oxidase
MPSALVAYATTHGQTGKIAARIAATLEREGVAAHPCDVEDGAATDPLEFDGIVVAGSVHIGKHQRRLVDWVTTRRASLEQRPSVFLSVSLTAAEDTEEARGTTQRCIDEFLEATGWAPERTVAVAGALQYLEYDVFTRTLMRLMMRRGGRPTDASQDYDYTDWDAVESIGREFAPRIVEHEHVGS